MRSGEHSSGLPEAENGALAAGAKAATAAVELEGQPVAMLVIAMAQAARTDLIGLSRIAVAGRSGVEEVYGVPDLDVGNDVCCDVCWIHHFSPLITAIRREEYLGTLSLSIPLPQDVDGTLGHKWSLSPSSWAWTAIGP
jgi:hypothetical protein